MNFKLFICFFICLLFVLPSFQYGILRVEEIWSTNDIPNVKIEDMIITESQIFIDYIEDLSGEGVTVEDVLFSDGSINVPGNLLTCCNVEFKTALFANGGIFADDGAGGFSFTVEDNTGNVDVQGTLGIQGGINVSDNFFVDGRNGDTRIEGILRPNGGVFVNEDALILDIDGQITSSGNVQVVEPVYFGDDIVTSNRVITRVATSTANGGTTFIEAQNAEDAGGNLILEPGDGAVPGNIFLGTDRNSDLFFGRTSLVNTNNGGITEFTGQGSFTGNGGDIFFDGGNSDTVGFGGDIILAPGLSSLDGRPGKLYVGEIGGTTAGHDVTIGRPPLSSGNGGETVFEGQSTLNGDGGNFYLRGGSVASGTGVPGDVILTPGIDGSSSTVIFGKNTATRLNIRRVRVAESGGETIFVGQNGTGGTGGDVYLRGGATGLTTTGGDVYLMPGSTVSGKPGELFLGLETESLYFGRPSVTGVSGTTIIAGQSAIDGSGGDIFFVGGNGISQGGDINILGGTGTGSVGGDVFLAGGDGESQGGELRFRAGNGKQRHGGDIAISSLGGDVTLNTRGTFSDGDIVVGPSAGRFYVDEVPVRIVNADIIVRGGSDSVTISNNPNAVISWNGTPVLKRTQLIPAVRSVNPVSSLTIRTDVSNISLDFDDILQALNQCGHGLVTSVTQPDSVTQQCP